MNKLQLISGLAFIAVAAQTATAHFSYQQTNPQFDLVQPKMREMISMANNAMAQGNYEKALAYTNLILIQDEVKYSINLTHIPDYQRAIAKEAAYEAIEVWKVALGEEVRFTEVEPKQARVRITFKPDIRSMGDAVAGYAVWNRQVNDWGGGRYSLTLTGDISLRTKTPTGREMSKEAMVHSAAHEIGHMLGLWDSPNFGDIMGPLHLKQPITKLSNQELTALKQARSEAHSIAQESLLAKSGHSR